jgi:broad specificity phosphatase PhoE
MKAVTVELSVAMAVTVTVPDDFDPSEFSMRRYAVMLESAARRQHPEWEDVTVDDHYPAEDGETGTDLTKQIEAIRARMANPPQPKGDR